MASRAQVTEALPDTLPADFGQWDDTSPSVAPVQAVDAEADSASDADKKTANELARTAASGDLPRGAAPLNSVLGTSRRASALRQRQGPTAAMHASRDIGIMRDEAMPAIDKVQSSTPRANSVPAAGIMTEFFRSLPSPLLANEVVIRKTSKDKRTIIAGVSAVLVVGLAAATTSLLNRGKMPSASGSAATSPMTSTAQQPGSPASAHDYSTLTTPPTAAARAKNGSEAVGPQPVQKNAGRQPQKAQVMTDQLHTPTRLNMPATSPEPAPLAPEGIAASDIQASDNGSAIGALFGRPHAPKVQIAAQAASSPQKTIEKTPAEQVITVPAGVALGLLMRDPRPIYPPIARSARVSGTVVLAATISSTGTVESLRVVSGPQMLRNSALEAVRTWRFRPYILNNQPTAIGTTINLHFALNN